MAGRFERSLLRARASCYEFEVVTILLGWLLGVTQGLRHAFEPDHIAAVSTLVAEQRGPRASMVYAASWGAGHALVLLVVGGSLVLLRAEMPERLIDLFELAVSAMLITLGVRALVRARRAGLGGPAFVHRHGDEAHTHTGVPSHVHVRGLALARFPLLVGVVHGLAGSGALAALVLPKLPSAVAGLVFMALYGLGATVGMALLAGLAGVPLARLMKSSRGIPILLGVSGTFSLVLGIAWGWPIAMRFAFA
jgi:hypothetical protein